MSAPSVVPVESLSPEQADLVREIEDLVSHASPGSYRSEVIGEAGAFGRQEIEVGTQKLTLVRDRSEGGTLFSTVLEDEFLAGRAKELIEVIGVDGPASAVGQAAVDLFELGLEKGRELTRARAMAVASDISVEKLQASPVDEWKILSISTGLVPSPVDGEMVREVDGFERKQADFTVRVSEAEVGGERVFFGAVSVENGLVSGSASFENEDLRAFVERLRSENAAYGERVEVSEQSLEAALRDETAWEPVSDGWLARFDNVRLHLVAPTTFTDAELRVTRVVEGEKEVLDDSFVAFSIKDERLDAVVQRLDREPETARVPTKLF